MGSSNDMDQNKEKAIIIHDPDKVEMLQPPERREAFKRALKEIAETYEKNKK